MQRRPQLTLTPEDRRSVRNWSFTVMIVYSTLLLSLLVVFSVFYGPTPPDTEMTVIPATGEPWFATEPSILDADAGRKVSVAHDQDAR